MSGKTVDRAICFSGFIDHVLMKWKKYLNIPDEDTKGKCKVMNIRYFQILLK
jgi:hypothetical protein